MPVARSKNVVAETASIPRSTLVRLYEDDRRAMYIDGIATDDRLNGALNELRPLSEIDTDAADEELRTVIRDVVRDELA